MAAISSAERAHHVAWNHDHSTTIASAISRAIHSVQRRPEPL